MNNIDPVHIDDSHPCLPHIVEAADALAKAAKHHVHSQAMSNPPCELCRLIAAYEKARG